MPDYYAILWRALKQGDPASAPWRDNVFQQTRQMLLAQLRAGHPPMSNTEIRLHADALEAAIKTIQSEFARTAGRGGAAEERKPRQPDRPTDRPPRRGPAAGAAPSGRPPVIWIALAVIVAALAAGAYALVAARHGGLTPTKARPAVAALADGDLPPGVDGGSTDADVPFFFRRQPVFYRTTHPAGTVIIDKQQHFLYLIQPNQVALRYGVGVGKPCADVAGLRRVTAKAEWPQWQPTADMVARKLAPAGIMQGAPGNPLGARLISLDDGTTRIHGTNAPKTIGTSVNFGCIRMVNDDIVDLYNRVATGARVILGD